MKSLAPVLTASVVLFGSAQAMDLLDAADVPTTPQAGLSLVTGASLLDAYADVGNAIPFEGSDGVLAGNFASALADDQDTSKSGSRGQDAATFGRAFDPAEFQVKKTVFGQEHTLMTEICDSATPNGPQFQSCTATLSTYDASELANTALGLARFGLSRGSELIN